MNQLTQKWPTTLRWPNLANLRHLVLFNNRWLSSLWLLLLLSTLAYQSYLALEYNSNDTTNIYLVIARIAAYNLLILLVLLWLPVLRIVNKSLQQRWLRHILPLELGKTVHRWMGHALLFFALFHGVFYLIYQDSLKGDFLSILIGKEADTVRSMRTTMYEFVSEDESIELMQQWVNAGWPENMYKESIAPLMKEDCTKCHSASSTQTYAVPSLPLSHYNQVKEMSQSGWLSRQFRINMTGAIMLIVFALVWVTSLAVFRHKKYHLFQKIHRLGYLLAILSLLHIPRVEYLFLPCLLLFIQWIQHRSTHSWPRRKATLVPIGTQHVALNIDLKYPLYVPVGHYVQLRIPSLHKKEWHSLSLMNSGTDCMELEIIIKDQGDWTRQLIQLAQNQSQVQVDVRGLFVSPMHESRHYPDGLYFVGGVGITPVLSVLESRQSSARRPIRLVWVFKDWTLFNYIAPRLERWQQSHEGLDIKCYSTTEKPSSISIENEITVISGRPNIEQHIDEWQQLQSRRNFAFVCGPATLTDTVYSHVKILPRWKLAVEHF